jgi:hypothetical protein
MMEHLAAILNALQVGLACSVLTSARAPAQAALKMGSQIAQLPAPHPARDHPF